MPPRSKRSPSPGGRTTSSQAATKNPTTTAKNACYIDPSYLPNLHTYRYSGADFSIMSRYVLVHYWNAVIGLVPRHIAPNCLTLIGFCVGIFSSVVLLFYHLVGQDHYPDWVWVLAAVCLFLYQTFDAIDGKQARRTGTGSPLGELFDHGCDALITPFVHINLALALNMPPWMVFCFVNLSSMGLFLAIFEQYCTGTLTLGYVSGPTEGILLACGVFLMTGICSRSWWDTNILGGPYEIPVGWMEVVGVDEIAENEWENATLNTTSTLHDTIVLEVGTLRDVVFMVFAISAIFTMSANIVHICTGPFVHRSPRGALMAASSMVGVLLLHVLIFLCFPAVHDNFIFAMELSFGCLASITVTRLTISRLTEMPYKPQHTYLILLVAVSVLGFVGLSIMAIFTESPITHLEANLGWALACVACAGPIVYINMIVHVFREVAGFLKINILSIKPRSAKE